MAHDAIRNLNLRAFAVIRTVCQVYAYKLNIFVFHCNTYSTLETKILTHISLNSTKKTFTN